jgi:hypothetical protein
MTIASLIQILAAEIAIGVLFEMASELQYQLSMLIVGLLLLSIGLLAVMLTQSKLDYKQGDGTWL